MRRPARRVDTARRHIRSALAVGGVLGGTLAAAAVDACAGRTPARPAPRPAVAPVASRWAATLDDVQGEFAAGRYVRADSILTAFHDRHAGTPQGAEALYWRALARLDAPSAPAVRLALADLDAYRAAGAPEHRAEAAVLRRTLVQLDSLRAVATAPTAPERVTAGANQHAGLVPRDSLRARDEELQRARADAAAVRAELDRVRRRLATPGRRSQQLPPALPTPAPGGTP